MVPEINIPTLLSLLCSSLKLKGPPSPFTNNIEIESCKCSPTPSCFSHLFSLSLLCEVWDSQVFGFIFFFPICSLEETCLLFLSDLGFPCLFNNNNEWENQVSFYTVSVARAWAPSSYLQVHGFRHLHPTWSPLLHQKKLLGLSSAFKALLTPPSA